ncbi:helix-turn-helix domain-containing protein [Streptomyces mirabilis]|uniref:helix-turn-helix domain-containing protein n=1 Tax=Streptomyces mirabilis TaxID=68239 RepID=UPI0036BC9CB5
MLVRSVERTVRGLGADGPAWQRLFAPLADDFDALTEDVLRPVPHLPAHPVALARFGLRALQPATAVARRWRTEEARALFAGAAAHLMYPLTGPASSAVGLMLVGAAHRFGWPVARGGSRTITEALAALVAQLGGTIETGVRVDSPAELAPARIIMLDTAPGAAARICGDRLPGRVRRAYRGWRHGPAAFKVDLAVRDGIPWTHEACRRAGTVHLGGTLEEVVRTEAQTAAGRMPERPFWAAEACCASTGSTSSSTTPGRSAAGRGRPRPPVVRQPSGRRGLARRHDGDHRPRRRLRPADLAAVHRPTCTRPAPAGPHGRGGRPIWLVVRPGCPVDPDVVAAELGDAALPVRVALGIVRPGLDGFRRSTRAAARAKALALSAGAGAPKVVAFTRVAPVALLADEPRELADFVFHTLGDLAVDDRRRELLRETLRAFLATNRSYAATADQLMVHRNTVHYRVQRAVDHYHLDLEANAFDLHFALTICRRHGSKVLRRK